MARALVLAITVCALRIALFDYRFFTFEALVHHDILSAAASFASSMHSMRISGDIAWWLPSLNDGGSAQYFDHFVGPLAPTAGHPAFMLWSEGVHLLSFLNVALPEFEQFLVYTYVLAPVLAYTAFGLLAFRLCGSWLGAGLAVAAYALGGPGIWNNAWMFHQEWFSVFLLLLAFDLAVLEGSRSHDALLGVALINAAASLNYWTIFASWFVGFFFLAHVAIYRRSWVGFVRRLPTSLIIGGSLIVCLAWVGLAALVYSEQSGVYIRGGTSGNTFPILDAVERAKSMAATSLWELARPIFRETEIPAHFARYVGLGVLLFSGIAMVCMPITTAWRRRRIAILIVALIGAVLVVFAAPPFQLLFQVTPGMGAIRHVFYFYLYFVEVCLILLAAQGCAILASTGRVSLALCGLVIALTVADLSRYYLTVEQAEQSFTRKYRNVDFTPDSPRAKTLSEPWAVISQRTPQDAGIYANMPIATEFWPRNVFSSSMASKEFSALPDEERARLTPDSRFGLALGQGGPVKGALRFSTIEESYNSFSAKLSADQAGTLIVNVLPDPNWNATLDGKRITTRTINLRMTGLDMPAGEHVVEFSYWPLSRYVYAVLKPVTLLALGILACIAFWRPKRIYELDGSQGNSP